MFYPTKPVVVLDANVLYPAPLRDLFLNLADVDLFLPKWSTIIQDEWLRNLLLNRKDLSREKLDRTTKLMNLAFPSAQVNDFEDLIKELNLPDLNDRHVLATAIKCKAEAIVTFNLKDFPIEYVEQYNIEVYSPDEFLRILFITNSGLVIKGFQNQLKSLMNPPIRKEQLIDTLENCKLKSAREIFKDL